MKNIIMVIAPQRFRDEELFETKAVLEKSGFSVKVAASKSGESTGVLGGVCVPDMLLDDINTGEIDALVFVGGAGAAGYWNNPLCQRMSREMAQAGKVIAAICIAPVILAKAGILKGKRATIWAAEAGQIKSAGALYSGSPVERDGNVITAAGPFASTEFGEAIAKALS